MIRREERRIQESDRGRRQSAEEGWNIRDFYYYLSFELLFYFISNVCLIFFNFFICQMTFGKADGLYSDGIKFLILFYFLKNLLNFRCMCGTRVCESCLFLFSGHYFDCSVCKFCITPNAPYVRIIIIAKFSPLNCMSFWQFSKMNSALSAYLSYSAALESTNNPNILKTKWANKYLCSTTMSIPQLYDVSVT